MYVLQNLSHLHCTIYNITFTLYYIKFVSLFVYQKFSMESVGILSIANFYYIIFDILYIIYILQIYIYIYIYIYILKNLY